MKKNHCLFSKVNFLFIAGAFCYYISLPPFGFWFLVFLVPVFWTFVIEHPTQIRFRTIYFGAFCFWIASAWWLVSPHPLAISGLLYLSIYWCLFFSASRIAVHNFCVPIIFAVPVCWIGCDYLRNHILGGFSFCSLEHALYRQPLLIQIADIGGGYFVGGMIMLVGVGVASGLGSLRIHKKSINRNSYIWCFFAGFIFIITIGYGFFQTAGFRISKSESNLTVAALQGNIPNKDLDRTIKTLKQLIDLTKKAVQNAQTEKQPLDLIIFPEIACPIFLLKYNSDLKPAEFDGWTDKAADYWEDRFEQLQIFVQKLGVPVLVGLSTWEFEKPPKPKQLNSAMLIDPKNNRTEYRYDKMRLVIFGEYLPFRKYLPENFFLNKLCQEIGSGTEPVAIPLDGGRLFLSVNICSQNTMPHLIRNQILTLKKQGKEPAILVNMSNDSWFDFSQQIDQHLAT
ncbi:MAG: apolipoprotein N-acyltransferase, partial [Planctomycetaceae bacterium]|nr:apolipoprotein N-acyltransferase [Planctomycetaceae bacterium]